MAETRYIIILSHPAKSHFSILAQQYILSQAKILSQRNIAPTQIQLKMSMELLPFAECYVIANPQTTAGGDKKIPAGLN